MTKDELVGELGCCLWEAKLPIYLIPEKNWDLIPDGTVLISIGRSIGIKGVTEIDLDTRSGYLPYGLIPRDHLANFMITTNAMDSFT